MKVDPDILAVLNTIVANGESQRVAKTRKKYEQRAERQLETQLELLSDEVEAVIPRTHPLFESVLLLTAIRKIARTQEEPEYKSALEVFPNGW